MEANMKIQSADMFPEKLPMLAEKLKKLDVITLDSK